MERKDKERKRTYEEVHREAHLERQDALEVRDLLRRERDGERLDVVVQMLDLAAADDGEDVRRLLHNVRNGDYKINARGSVADRAKERK